jgi:hypothetical protein
MANTFFFKVDGVTKFSFDTDYFTIPDGYVYCNSFIEGSIHLITEEIVTDIQYHSPTNTIQYKYRLLNIQGGLCEWDTSESSWTDVNVGEG